MPNNNSVTYLPLGIVGAIGLATAKIPAGTHPAFFYAVSVAVTFTIMTFFFLLSWGFDKWGEEFAMVPGLLAVFGLLTLAIVVLVDGMQYIPVK